MAFTNKRNIPLPVAVWLATDNYDKDPTYLSGSQLSQSDRQIVLSYRANSKSTDLASMVPAKLGHAINDSIDQAWKSPALLAKMALAGFPSNFNYVINPVMVEPGQTPVYIQQRYNEPVAGRILSGAPDIILAGVLNDYKSTSVFAYQKKEIGDYLWQLTTYRYLARDVITDDTARIQFILKDWSEYRATKDPEYPQTPCPVMMVRVGTAAECLTRIIARVNRLNGLMSLDQAELPLCTDDELWLDPPRFAFYKDPNADGKGRATRVFDTFEEATAHQGLKPGKIITRKGEPKACNFCESATICQQRASWNT